MLKDSILGVVRHGLTTAGGALVADGLMSASEMQAIVGGVVTLVGVLWSIAEKRLRA